MTSAPWDALSGQYQLRPGSNPGVVGQRPILANGQLTRLLRGQRREQVGRTLNGLFTLCAHAHRRTAELAWAAALGESSALTSSEPPLLLWLETARDHLRSIALDWPQRLPEGPVGAPAMTWLRECPLPLASGHGSVDATVAREALLKLRLWLEHCVVGQALRDWLPAQRHPDALASWCEAGAAQLAPARCLARCYPLAHTLRPEARCLDVLDADDARQSELLRELAQAIAEQSEFAQQPTWQNQCAESGPWSRLRHRSTQSTLAQSAWTRLSARWTELLEIAAAPAARQSLTSAPLLASGALRLGRGAALAWCEMARGLLLHWVQLDANGTVQDYRVLAPTEWNFHPNGALSKAVAALARDDTLSAQVLAAAFDPCVVFTVRAEPQ